jgi:alpha-L-fucosidase
MHTKSSVLAVLFLITLRSALLSAENTDTLNVIPLNRITVVTDPSKGFNEYTGWGVFPGKSTPVRKITMHVRFACPDTMRCADWDYADHILLKRTGGKKGDTLNYEIGRIITPYGGFFGRDWSFDWETDVTDFSLLLRDSVEINFIHSGYEPNHDRGWLVTIRFEIITGPAVAVPVAIRQIYNEKFPYGDNRYPIDSLLRAITFETDENTDFVRLRIIQTGHGMDSPENCAEFCSKYRQIWFDGQLLDQKQIWKKCGDNPVYPQAGTWIFDRGGWCPGDLVQPDIYHLTVNPGQPHSLGFVMEPYTSVSEHPGAQVISAYLIEYQEPLAETDIEITEVIVPSDKTLYSRNNPASANPLIVVRNNGRKDVNGLVFKYATEGTKHSTYAWPGSLAFNRQAAIQLPGEITGQADRNTFSISVLAAGGQADEYPADNVRKVTYTAAPMHDTLLVFYLLTNNEPAHNAWELRTGIGVIIAERKSGSLEACTEYRDTLRLPPGAYSLYFYDTEGDGLEFWYNSKGGRGEARLMDARGNLIKAFEPDCGSGWEYHFSTGPNPQPTDPAGKSISLYPTRTEGKTTLRYFANQIKDITVKIISDPGAETVEEHIYNRLKEGTFGYDLSRYAAERFYLKILSEGEVVFNKRIRKTPPKKEETGDAYIMPTDTLVRKKLQQWQDWKFGAIIHWGPYSQWGVVESWSLCPEDEPWCRRSGPYAEDYCTYREAYKNLPAIFNPTAFDPDAWAEICHRAGMKYLVFTTKHHDGFCMFNSQTTDYKITGPGSAFAANPRSDVTREVFRAFRQKGMGIGAYFSKPDWNSKDYWWPYFPVTDRNVNYNPEKYPDRWQRFREFTHQQIGELMTGYGDIDILWLDGGWVRPANSLTDESKPWLGKNQWVQDVQIPQIAAMARKNQPGILMVDRSVHGEFENYRTPEQQIPDKPLPYPWESCITLGDNWYATGPGENYKSARWVIHTLVEIVAKGGNFLLGIGPDKTGALPPQVLTVLDSVSRWINRNAEAIYHTRPLQPYQSGNLCFTQSTDEKQQYAIYLNKNNGNLPAFIEIPDNMAVRHKNAELPAYGLKLKIETVNGKKGIKLPAALRQSHTPALVIRLGNR